MLEKIEKKLGRYAIKNLIYYILGAYAIGYVLYFIEYKSGIGIYSALLLEPALVMKGQIWRLVTWVFTIPQSGVIMVIFMFLLYYFIGRSLEQTIGSFRYDLYIFSGWFFMTLGAMAFYWISGAILGSGNGISIDISTYYINLASFLAFAAIYPQYRVYLFGIVPIKMKWLAIFDVIYLGYTIIGCALYFTEIGANTLIEYGYTQEYIEYYRLVAAGEIVSIVMSLLNFLIFWFTNKNIKRFSPKQAKRRADFQRSYNAGQRQNSAGERYGNYGGASAQEQKKTYRAPSGNGEIVHRCAICGRTSVEYPDLTFRYCSKCAGNHEYCQDHLFTHEHVK